MTATLATVGTVVGGLWLDLSTDTIVKVLSGLVAAVLVRMISRLPRLVSERVDAAILTATAPEFEALHHEIRAVDQKVERLWRAQAETIKNIIRNLHKLEGDVRDLRGKDPRATS